MVHTEGFSVQLFPLCNEARPDCVMQHSAGMHSKGSKKESGLLGKLLG